MEYRRLGNSSLEVSAICLGTMTFGEQNSAAEAHDQLDRALAAGVNFFDSAEMYPVPSRHETSGASERILGQWLARQKRELLVVSTKVAGPNRGLGWIRGGPLSLDAENIRSAVEGSLERLGTDYIDLYQIHWPARNQPMFGGWQYDPMAEHSSTPIREQLDALAGLVEEGRIRHIGLSNEHPWGVMQFLRLAELHGLPRVASIQNVYNLISRVYDYGLAELCHREHVSLLGYSPLGFGHLTGKYLDLRPSGSRLARFPGFGKRYASNEAQQAIEAYTALARQRGIPPATMALSFVYHRWCVTSTVIGATSMTQLEENLKAWNFRPDPDLQAAIDDIHRQHPNPAP
jgi:aryl-alcohol dehydrogenase-like predicted oxidoreductase